jgi:Tol biopolymer transport system component
MSVRSNGKEAPGANSADSSISIDGRFVAFTSDGNLGGGDANGMLDVYVHDRKTGRTRRMSVKSDHNGVPADSESPAISANGRYVAFQSTGAFVNGDTNGVSDVYVHDRRTGKTRRASIRANGAEPASRDTAASSPFSPTTGR